MTQNPTDLFMGRAAEGSLPFLQGCRYLIHDRDTFAMTLAGRTPRSSTTRDGLPEDRYADRA